MSGNDAAHWFEGARSVLFVHAHPDDETITTGGTIAALAAQDRAGLVTLTRGERGEVRPGPFVDLAGTEKLAPHREQERAAALILLGLSREALLGAPPARAAGSAPRRYQDSGMRWGPHGRAEADHCAGPDALTRAPAMEALADLLAVADAWEADAVVSYDAQGGYGHPDHVFAHRLARAVAHGLDVPFWEIVDEETAEESAKVIDETLFSVDIGPWLDRKAAALRCYPTQLEVVAPTEGGEALEIVHVGGQRQSLPEREYFRRLVTHVPA